MKKELCIILIVFLNMIQISAQNVFSVEGNKTLLNGKEFQAIGLRCSNALMSEETTNKLIAHLDLYKEYGLNTISAYFMGSRYSDVNGFNLDATLKQEYASRMGRIIEACDKREMVVWSGCSIGGRR